MGGRRVGIIGAGPGGLSVAMLLAQAGADVTVYERHKQVGGRSATITAPSAAGTFQFDMGPTFFLYPRVLNDIFAACGYDLEREIELIRLDPQYHLVFEAGGEIRATSDMTRLAEEVSRFAPQDAAALPRFFADNRAKLAAFRPILESPFNGPLDLVPAGAMLRSLKLMRPHRTVDSDLATYFSDERVRLAFSFQSKYLGMSPFRCPSLFTILSFMEYEFGVYHPRGGCGAVMTAMERIAREMGVTFKMGEPVQEILFQGRRATGVRTAAGCGPVRRTGDQRRFRTGHVHPGAGQTAPPLDRPEARNAKKYSCSTFMLYLGIKGDLPDLAHHTIYLSKEYRRNVQEIEDGVAPPDRALVLRAECLRHRPGARPEGYSTLYMLVPVGHRVGDGIDWAAATGQLPRPGAEAAGAAGRARHREPDRVREGDDAQRIGRSI